MDKFSAAFGAGRIWQATVLAFHVTIQIFTFGVGLVAKSALIGAEIGKKIVKKSKTDLS